uniref:Uncharacterized protein n=1 Tax=Rhizobium rhizogenes TaxID=359 RepID=A0A7S5DS23_RHIRH|nr:hypothetical protein pC5.8d_712 [Rhizobium rhizogenes]
MKRADSRRKSGSKSILKEMTRGRQALPPGTKIGKFQGRR